MSEKQLKKAARFKVGKQLPDLDTKLLLMVMADRADDGDEGRGGLGLRHYVRLMTGLLQCVAGGRIASFNPPIDTSLDDNPKGPGLMAAARVARGASGVTFRLLRRTVALILGWCPANRPGRRFQPTRRFTTLDEHRRLNEFLQELGGWRFESARAA